MQQVSEKKKIVLAVQLSIPLMKVPELTPSMTDERLFWWKEAESGKAL